MSKRNHCQQEITTMTKFADKKIPAYIAGMAEELVDLTPHEIECLRVAALISIAADHESILAMLGVIDESLNQR